jgi:hypothetical protein
MPPTDVGLFVLRSISDVTYLPTPEGKVVQSGPQPIADRPMQTPPLDPDVADTAPTGSILTPYDIEHTVTYMRLLDAAADEADWREVARIVLHLDPDREPDRARLAFETHLERAKWIARYGYRQLLRGA